MALGELGGELDLGGGRLDLGGGELDLGTGMEIALEPRDTKLHSRIRLQF